MTDREKFEEFMAREGRPTAFVEQQYWRVWQAALASQQQADDGWIEWAGGECPVSEEARVEVKFKGDDVGYVEVACWLEWGYNFSTQDDHIIAYRVMKP